LSPSRDPSLYQAINQIVRNKLPLPPRYIDPIPAAVLIPIILRDENETVLFTQRGKDLKHHAGQISFPGGCLEANDSSPLECALRETYEEVGIHPDRIDVLGSIGEWPSYSGFNISVFIGKGYNIKYFFTFFWIL